MTYELLAGELDTMANVLVASECRHEVNCLLLWLNDD
jgi:hypothetical protein